MARYRKRRHKALENKRCATGPKYWCVKLLRLFLQSYGTCQSCRPRRGGPIPPPLLSFPWKYAKVGLQALIEFSLFCNSDVRNEVVRRCAVLLPAVIEVSFVDSALSPQVLALAVFFRMTQNWQIFTSRCTLHSFFGCVLVRPFCTYLLSGRTPYDGWPCTQPL